MSWGPPRRRFAVILHHEGGELSTSRAGLSEKEVRAKLAAEYPGCQISACQPMFMKGDSK